MFIPIRAQVVSLAITFTFVTAEIGALLVARALNRVFETFVLRKNQKVFIYRHCNRLKLISTLILLSFIGLEAFASSLTSTDFKDVKREENCLRMELIDGSNSTRVDDEMRAALISFKCLHVNGNLFEQRAGNVSLDSPKAFCDELVLYRFNRTARVFRPASKTEKQCKKFSLAEECAVEGAPDSIEVEFCTHYMFERGQLLLGSYLEPKDSGTDLVELFETDIESNMSSTVISIIVDNVMDELMQSNVQDEVHFRRKSFTRVVRTKCDLTQSTTEGTDVPVFVLVTVICVWSVCTLALLIMLIASRRWALIDLSDPLWWAHGGEIPKAVPKKSLSVALVDSVARVSLLDSFSQRV
eukprot:TRINITY_DN14130_c0_g1_i1.p1 TRINITY_DN14130_c0_g1~~TRINITY_DN14130_c0_g1_i1.p1  ORF type:complete len:356 (-),score=34.50 TRINITY_DN14130_c0_g1_i1:4318-5385(-)